MTANLPLPAATQRIGRPVGSLADWLSANLDGLALGFTDAALCGDKVLYAAAAEDIRHQGPQAA